MSTKTLQPPATTSPSHAVAARSESLTKTYGSGDAVVTALDAVDIAIGAGRFTAIMGPSGSGKSTLMHCLAGLDRPTSGRVFLGGTDLTALPDKELTVLRRERVGFVFQAFNLVPTFTAIQNIRLPLTLAGRRPDRDWERQIVATLGLGDRLGHRPGELSGGQQQRVAIARALSTRPDVIFADEPTGALDTRTGAQMLDFLRRCVDEFGQTIVMVTHDPNVAAYADNVLLLADGRPAGTIESPTPDTVLAAMRQLGA